MTYFGYRMLARFAEILPLAAIRPLSRLGAAVAVAIRRRQAQLVRRNLQRSLGFDPSAAQVKECFASYIRYWLESFRLPVVPAQQLNHRVRVTGYEHLAAAREQGNGVVFALPHMGNWEVAGAWLVARGIPLTVVVEKLEPPKLLQWFTEFRASIGLDVVVSGPRVGAELAKGLANNGAIALLCDRDVDGTGTPVEFFGEVTKLPRGPVVLAHRSGAALLPVCTYEDGAGFHLVVDPPVPTRRSEDRKADINAATQELAGRIERLIGAAPEQWHLFQPNWPSDTENYGNQ